LANLTFKRKPPIVTNGLINYWPIFNGNALDYIGQAHVSSLINASFVSDRFGNPKAALYLNNGYAAVPPGVYFNSTFTITAWVYPLDRNFHFQRIIEFGNGDFVNTVGFAYYYNSASSYAFLGDYSKTSTAVLFSNRLTIQSA
jgi:hypothetical protein